MSAVAEDWPCRLLLHCNLPGEPNHVDCFILDGGEELATLRLPEGFAQRLQSLSPAQRNRLVLRVREPGQGGPLDLWPAAEQPRHRRHYWTYSGQLSAGRGSIAEIGRGRLLGWRGGAAWLELR
ncbi:MAG: hypothetical protein K1X75_09950 [Leptospirales bacterium]|nr:hypothetical protein [Leptospirales bacterium]